MIRKIAQSLALLFLLGGIVHAQDIKVSVFPEIKRQKITSIGGNYCQTRLTNNAWDAIGEETLKQFKPGYVRVALPIRSTDPKLLVQQPLVISLLNAMKRMKNEFGVQNFTVSTWNLPNELIVNPTARNKRIVKPEAYPVVAELLTSFFLTAKNEYGVEADNFSFNEANGGWELLFSPQEIVAFIKLAGKRFEEAGLKTKFLIADNSETKGTVEYASVLLADTAIRKYLGPLAFHSWWSENIDNNEFERIAGLAKAFHLQVWCSELGFDAQAHTIPGMFQSWDYALRFAKISHRMMKYAETEVSLYWTWQNDYSIMSRDLKTVYPSYYVTKQLTDYLNTGTQIVHSLSSDPGILPISAIRPDGSRVVQLINLKKTPASVSISGFGSADVDMISTTEKNTWEEKKKVARSKNGIIKVELQPGSVNMLVLK